LAFEWMTDPAFRDTIEQRVNNIAGISGMEQYEPAIADRIASLIAANAARHRQSEQLRKMADQRSDRDALASVSVLIQEASRLAKAAGRTTVTTADFETAFKNKFCQVWPVC
jgi:hypothetical protein